MASDESVAIQSSSMQEEDEYDMDDGSYHQSYSHNLSRLSMCTSNSTVYGDYEDDGGGSEANYFRDDDEDNSDGGGPSIRMFMSRLSIESFHCDGDADEELSDEKEGKEISGALSSDSDKELLGCYSLPATPPRGINRSGGLNQQQQLEGLLLKDYASENETQKDYLLHRHRMRQNKILRRRRRRRRIVRDRWLERETTLGDQSDYRKNMVHKEEEVDEDKMISMEMDGGGRGGGGIRNNYDNYSYNSNCGNSFSGGESEGGGGLVVITRPKGGRRSLCMDLEEVKACRDLGFELEHDRTLEIMSSRLSLSGSTLDNSSGGNSPIANWRISSPGDDPRDVKARLKVWAQAVALASTSRHGC